MKLQLNHVCLKINFKSTHLYSNLQFIFILKKAVYNNNKTGYTLRPARRKINSESEKVRINTTRREKLFCEPNTEYVGFEI